MARPSSTRILLPLLAALVTLLVAWFVPLPRLVLSDEEKAAARMPSDRAEVQTAQAQFEKAQSTYKAYITSHNVGGAIDEFESAIGAWQAHSFGAAERAQVVAAASPVLDYMANLQAYAQAGEGYLTALRHYDDELMAWTRSLGAQSDALRPDTWPIVEYLKRYPPPVGETSDYEDITASDVTGETASLKEHVAALQAGGRSASGPAANSLDGLLSALNQDIAAIREAGRSIEYREGLHLQYRQLLGQYDQKVQAVATGPTTGALSSGRVVLATGLDIVLGAITLAGLAALFIPRRGETEEMSR